MKIHFFYIFLQKKKARSKIELYAFRSCGAGHLRSTADERIGKFRFLRSAQPLADTEAENRGEDRLDNGSRDERDNAGRKSGRDRALGQGAEHRHADHVVEHRSGNQRDNERAGERLAVLDAPADNERHQRERNQKAAGRADEFRESAGKSCENRHADRAEDQINDHGNRRELRAEYNGRQCDREGLHRHRHAARHRNGNLRHDGDNCREKTCVAGFTHGKDRFRRGFCL